MVRERGCHRRFLGLCLLVASLWLALTRSVQAAPPTPDEMAEARRWVAAKFEGIQEPKWAEPGLVVLANHGSVEKNARGRRPMKIVDAQFHRGLYCHAPSKIVVRLPAPAETLHALVGVDSNQQTRPGRGSVVFSVKIGDQEAFRSEVLREGTAGVPVAVDLDGATEFVLEVGDAGDGISCDQADWVEAKVVLADGETLWLDELPMVGLELGPYTTDPPFSFTYGDRSFAELLKNWKLE